MHFYTSIASFRLNDDFIKSFINSYMAVLPLSLNVIQLHFENAQQEEK